MPGVRLKNVVARRPQFGGRENVSRNSEYGKRFQPESGTGGVKGASGPRIDIKWRSETDPRCLGALVDGDP